jgi:putative ATPase
VATLFDDDPDARAEAGDAPPARTPPAERMRPRTLDEVAGQSTVVGPDGFLRRAIAADRVPSLVFWGPPGCGKTTLARLIAEATNAHFVPFSAVTSGIQEIKRVMVDAERLRRATGRRTILFVDEIHRFNRAQQDAFLPHVERGDIVLIGATTENPSFEVNAALLSRSKVYVLRPLAKHGIRTVIDRAMTDPRGLADKAVRVDEGERDLIAESSQGDARAALNTLEFVVDNAKDRPGEARAVTRDEVLDALRRGAAYYDKAGEEHFNLISALHKSLRNSDPDASIYWLARMLESGEDPLYVARRMVRFASEDVGNADPSALVIALGGKDAAHFLGMPECTDALAQVAVYLATAPKSNAITRGYGAAREDIRAGRTGPVPHAIRNAPTRLMKDLGYGKGYQYAHDLPDAVADMECLPEDLRGRKYYQPTDHGFEKTIRERMAWWEDARKRRIAGASAAPEPPEAGKTKPGES